MKKKLLAALLSVTLIAGMLAGCGSKTADQTTSQTTQEPAQETTQADDQTQTEDAEENKDAESTASAEVGEDPQLEKTIKILSIWAEDNDNGILINNICKRYQEQVNPNFSYEYELVSSDNLKQKIATLAASNDLPDIFAYEAGKPIVELIEADKVVDIGAELDKMGVADYLEPSAEALLKNLSGTEKLYDLPLGMNVEGFYYNKALFEQAGIEKAPETWDEFEEVLEKLDAAGIQPLTTGGADKWGATRLINAYTVRTMGPNAMRNADEGTTSYTDEGYVAAAQKIQDWADKGYFGQGVTTVDMNTAGNMLMSGQAAIFYNGSWFVQNLNDTSANAAGEDGIGFFNVPVADAAISPITEYSMNCGNILCFSKAKYDEASSYFLKYFVEEIGNEAMSVLGSLKGYTYTVDPGDVSGYTQNLLDEIGKSTSAFTWYEATMGSEVSTVTQENVQTLLNGDMTALEYMQSIQDAHDMAAY